jgi:hypothetical protein
MKLAVVAAAIAATLVNFAAAADLDPIVIKGNSM